MTSFKGIIASKTTFYTTNNVDKNNVDKNNVDKGNNVETFF